MAHSCLSLFFVFTKDLEKCCGENEEECSLGSHSILALMASKSSAVWFHRLASIQITNQILRSCLVDQSKPCFKSSLRFFLTKTRHESVEIL